MTSLTDRSLKPRVLIGQKEQLKAQPKSVKIEANLVRRSKGNLYRSRGNKSQRGMAI